MSSLSSCFVFLGPSKADFFYVLCLRYGRTFNVLYFIMTSFFRRYNQTSLLVILLEESFDQSCSSTDFPAAVASLHFATVHCHAITIGLLSNNIGSTL